MTIRFNDNPIGWQSYLMTFFRMTILYNDKILITLKFKNLKI